MRLFIAREAVDLHLEIAGDLVDPRAPLGSRLAAAGRSGLHYAWWYPSRWLGWGRWPRYRGFGELAKHVRYVDRSSRRLARALFHCMVRHGPGLEKRQAVLGRLVEIGAECFMMSAACIHAMKLVGAVPENRGPVELADAFCRQSRRRVESRFRALFRNDDPALYRIARRALEGRYAWLVEGIVDVQPHRAGQGSPSPLEDPTRQDGSD
jgi:hypothetical protein